MTAAEGRDRDARAPAAPAGSGRARGTTFDTAPAHWRAALADLAAAAGREVLSVYAGTVTVRCKDDRTPVTDADLRSQEVLRAGLAAWTPGVPLVAEEGDPAPPSDRRGGHFWCVDPLDGTRDFVARTGEFSVNVALVADGRPVVGLVHVPVAGLTYAGAPGHGAWRRRGGGPWRAIRTAPPRGRRLRVLVSRQHADAATHAWLASLAPAWEVERLHRGSAWKACSIAEGRAHVYPRFGPTHLWDTAAAEAVVEAAGGVLRRAGGAEPLRYDGPDTRNPAFYVAWGPDAPHP